MIEDDGNYGKEHMPIRIREVWILSLTEKLKFEQKLEANMSRGKEFSWASLVVQW